MWLQVLIKQRSKVSGIKKNSAAITKFFEELAKIGEYSRRPAECQTHSKLHISSMNRVVATPISVLY